MNNTDLTDLQNEAIDLLRQLIATPSFSKEENDTAELIGAFFDKHQIPFSRIATMYMRKQTL